MVNTIIKWSGVVALVILAIMALRGLSSGGTPSVGTAVNCGSTTCFTTLGVLTSFQDDGTAIFNGAVTLAGAVAQSGAALFTGGVFASSTIQTSGPLVNYTTNSATSTTSVGCIQMTSTSTASPIKLMFFATTTVLNGTSITSSLVSSGLTPAGWVVFGFGNCP